MNRPAEGALGPYLRAIRSHRLLVVVVTLVAIAASIAWTTLRPPSYQATANILLTPLAQEDTQAPCIRRTNGTTTKVAREASRACFYSRWHWRDPSR